MNTNDDKETLELLDVNVDDVKSNVSSNNDINKPQPISIDNLTNQVTPTDLQNTDISNFGQEGIPLNNINQNPNPSSLETISLNGEYNNIGMVPPNAHIEQKPPKKKNKTLIIIIAFVLVLAVGIFIYMYLGQGNKAQVKLILKEVNIQVGEPVSTKIENYIEKKNIDISSCMINTSNVLNNKIGNYKYKIICGNDIFEGNIHVLDKNVPVVETKNIIKKPNEELNIDEFITSCQDDSICHYKYVDESRVNEAIKQLGTYEVIINVSDDYDNKIDVRAYLIVLNNDITHNLVCTSKDISSEDNKYTYTIKDTIALNGKSGFSYGNLAYRDYILNFIDEAFYGETKQTIDNGYIEIGNIKGKATFSDATKTIRVEKILTLEELKKEFNNFASNYSEIRSKYQNDSRGFSCLATKAN